MPKPETAFNHALAYLSTCPADHPALIAAKVHLAELYLEEHRPEDAEPVLRRTVAVLQGSPLPNTTALAAADEDLAVACVMRRKFSESESLLRQSQTLLEAKLGPGDPTLTSGLLTMAGALMAEHRYLDAVAPAERAWQIVNAHPASVTETYRASTMVVLSTVYFRAGRTAEAESYASQAVDRAEALLGAQHPRVGQYLANYAIILRRAGRKRDADDVQKRADAILAQYPPMDSPGYTVNVAASR